MNDAQTTEVERSGTIHDQEVDQRVDEHLAELYEERSSRQRRMETIKFGVLAAIMLGTVIVILLLRPLIFGRIVPAVMSDGESGTTSNDDETVNQEEMPVTTETAVPGQEEIVLPIISSPPDEDDVSATEPPPAQTYVVQEGDTLNSIARQFNTTVAAIMAANTIPNPDNIQVGTTLTIPQP